LRDGWIVRSPFCLEFSQSGFTFLNSKWLRASSDSAVKYYRPKIAGKLTPFEPKLLFALEADAHHPKKDRRTVLMLFTAIKKEGYSGGYTMVTDFIRKWRNQGATGKLIYVPLRFELDEAFQEL
jgi:hypothetical protein